ncbi:MAG: hypothetical protein K2P48_00585 [Lachnospiraceae bacterium]|nr:hypothetical protein [Lachnospiraceae bacterium]
MNQNAVEYIKNHIKEFLPPENQDAEVPVEEVVKHNDRVLTGLTILKDGSHIAPAIYLEPYWEEVEKGRLLSSVMKEIAQIQQEGNIEESIDLSESLSHRAVHGL